MGTLSQTARGVALLQLIDLAGLTFAEALRVFSEHQAAHEPELNPYILAADQMPYVREGEVECDGDTYVSKGADAGAYVLGWIWVTDEAAGVETFADETVDAWEDYYLPKPYDPDAMA